MQNTTHDEEINTTQNTTQIDFEQLDLIKLKNIIKNYNKIMDLVNYKKFDEENNTVDISIKNTSVPSIRINTNLHKELKDKAKNLDISFTKLINTILYNFLDDK